MSIHFHLQKPIRHLERANLQEICIQWIRTGRNHQTHFLLQISLPYFQFIFPSSILFPPTEAKGNPSHIDVA